MLKCEICGLEMHKIPTVWRFVKDVGDKETMVCMHWFGIPASEVPKWEIVINEMGDDYKIVWGDGGKALEQGQINLLEQWSKERGAKIG